MNTLPAATQPQQQQQQQQSLIETSSTTSSHTSGIAAQQLLSLANASTSSASLASSSSALSLQSGSVLPSVSSSATATTSASSLPSSSMYNLSSAFHRPLASSSSQPSMLYGTGGLPSAALPTSSFTLSAASMASMPYDWHTRSVQDVLVYLNALWFESPPEEISTWLEPFREHCLTTMQQVLMLSSEEWRQLPIKLGLRCLLEKLMGLRSDGQLYAQLLHAVNISRQQQMQMVAGLSSHALHTASTMGSTGGGTTSHTTLLPSSSSSSSDHGGGGYVRMVTANQYVTTTQIPPVPSASNTLSTLASGTGASNSMAASSSANSSNNTGSSTTASTVERSASSTPAPSVVSSGTSTPHPVGSGKGTSDNAAEEEKYKTKLETRVREEMMKHGHDCQYEVLNSMEVYCGECGQVLRMNIRGQARNWARHCFGVSGKETTNHLQRCKKNNLQRTVDGMNGKPTGPLAVLPPPPVTAAQQQQQESPVTVMPPSQATFNLPTTAALKRHVDALQEAAAQDLEAQDDFLRLAPSSKKQRLLHHTRDSSYDSAISTITTSSTAFSADVSADTEPGSAVSISVATAEQQQNGVSSKDEPDLLTIRDD